MTLNDAFQMANGLALLAWVYLAIFPFRPATSKIIIGTIVTLLAAVYATHVFGAIHADDFSKFSTLEGVQSLLNSPGATFVGWVHYLAFDLMVGLFIASNAARHGISYWYILPCFFFTFMLGPAGLLLYLLIRWAVTKQYFAENF